FARHPWIEEIGPKAHLDRNVGPQRDRLFQPALADKAPRADDVGHHLDWQGCAHGGLPLPAPQGRPPRPPPPTLGGARSRATNVPTSSVGLRAASVIVGLIARRSRPGESMVRLSTLAIRRATRWALRRSVLVKAARIDPSCSRQAKSTLRTRRLKSRAAST